MPAAGEPTGHETPRGGADLTSRAASASQGAGTDARAGGASGAQATQPVAAPTSPPVQEAPNGVVRLEGQGVKGAQLVGTSTLTLARRRAEALGSDEVPPGTYTLVVEFTDGTRITRTNLLEVVADQTTTVRCSLAQYQCVIGEP